MFPTDFSAISAATLALASEIAAQFDATLHIVHADSRLDAGGADLEMYHPRDKKDWSPRFRAFIESLDLETLGAVESAEVAGISAPEIVLKYAELQDIDLIVLGTHGRRGLGRILLGSTAEEVVRLAGCPVLTVSKKAVDSLEPAIKNILVPTDFSDYSRNALRFAERLATALGARLDLLHVIEHKDVPGPYMAYVPSLNSPEMEEDVKKALAEIEKTVTGVEVTSHVDRGLAADKIATYAAQNETDLIVIASHGLTGFDRFIQGSVVQEVVRLAPCSVCTVKAPKGK